MYPGVLYQQTLSFTIRADSRKISPFYVVWQMQRTHEVGAQTRHLELSSLRPQSLWELRSGLRRVVVFHVTWMGSTLLSREVLCSVKAGEMSQVTFRIQGVWIPQNVAVRIDLDYTYQVRLCKFRLNYLHYFKQLCDGGRRYRIGYKHNQVNGVGNSPEQRFCNAITATEGWTAILIQNVIQNAAHVGTLSWK